jgi:8-oxo-dGTP pyrophosphatase MutT (NUDIX family)
MQQDGLVWAVSRRDRPEDLGLPGGKIDAGEAPYTAMVRETFEETGVTVTRAIMVFERVDETDGNVAWCYLAQAWIGRPSQQESGIFVSLVPPARLLDERCTFREYNRALFAKTRIET